MIPLGYVIKVADSPIRWTSLKIDKVLAKDPWTFTAVLPEYQNIALASSVEILKNDVTIFKGKVGGRSVTDSPTTVDEIEINGRNNLDNLKNYLMGEGEVEDDPGSLISDILPGTGLSAGTINNFGYKVKVRLDRQTRLDFLQQLSEMIDWEYITTLDNKLNWKEEVGVDKAGFIIITLGENGESQTWSDEMYAVKTRWYAYGHGDGPDRVTLPNPYYVQSMQAIQTYGVREGLIDAKDIVTQRDLIVYAKSVLERYKTPPRTYVVNFTDTYEPNAYDVGDTITLVDPKLGIEGEFKIYEVHVSVDSESGECVQLVLSNRLPNLAWIVKKTEDRTRLPPVTPISFGGGGLPLLSWQSTIDVRDLATDANWVLVDTNGHRYHVKETSSDSYVGYQIFDADGIVSTYLQTQNMGSYWKPPGKLSFMDIGSNNHVYWCEDNEMHVWDLGNITNLYGGTEETWHPYAPLKVFDGVDAGLSIPPYSENEFDAFCIGGTTPYVAVWNSSRSIYELFKAVGEGTAVSCGTSPGYALT